MNFLPVFPVTWVDHVGAPWTAYAHREGDLIVCDDGTQLFPEGEGVSWLHGHFTRADAEMSCLLVIYGLERQEALEEDEK